MFPTVENLFFELALGNMKEMVHYITFKKHKKDEEVSFNFRLGVTLTKGEIKKTGRMLF